jgi:lauroyl/myristoyl acyltransferase
MPGATIRIRPRDLSRKLRQAVTLSAMRGVLLGARPLPPRAAIALGAALGHAAAAILPLRLRLQRSMDLGLGRGNVPPDAISRYFRHLGQWFGWSMAVYHRGFWKSTVPEGMAFDPSVEHLDEAVSRGHGVILASPHQFCHEMGAAFISGRHKVVALVREGKSRSRERMKERWYASTGMEVVKRARRASVIADTLAYLRVLKSGRLLAITPDVLVSPEKGVGVKMFGREVFLSPGLIVLAMRAQSPIVTCYIEREPDGRFVHHFTRPIEFSKHGDREATAREGLQAWCTECEGFFRRNPGNWMFWLDKRWARSLRRIPSEASPA